MNKPYGILCQFSDRLRRPNLSDFGPFPKNVYPVGRLDIDSEGLILLTNDGLLKHYLLEPQYQHPRKYLVQVERIPSNEAIKKLRRGVKIDGRITMPAFVRILENEPELPPRPVPIRFRKNVPTSWLEITLFEGKNRQVRKMTAAVGHPTLRLIRVSIGPLPLENLKPGETRELNFTEINSFRMYLMGKSSSN